MKRRLAREMTVQSLYHLEMNEVTAEDAVTMLVNETSEEENELETKASDVRRVEEHVRRLVQGVLEHKAAIDDILQHYLTGWQVDRLSRVDRQILRIACYEMVFSDDVPPKAVINEAIELAKHFGTEESGKFVNGVLGKLYKALDELKSQA